MVESSALEMKEIISLALSKHFMVKSSYGSKTNSVTLILLKGKKKKKKKSPASCTCIERQNTKKKGTQTYDQYAVSL